MIAGASSGPAADSQARSPPAKNVFLADVMITPVIPTRSATSASTHSPIATR